MRRAAILVTCIFVTACGGGGSRLTKEEYANRANAICARFNKDVAPPSSVRNVHQLAALARRTEPALKDALKKLRRLKPPKEEAQTAKLWLAAVDALIADVRSIRERAEANDLAGVRRVTLVANRDDARANALARALGATVCAESS